MKDFKLNLLRLRNLRSAKAKILINKIVEQGHLSKRDVRNSKILQGQIRNEVRKKSALYVSQPNTKEVI